MDPIGKRQDAPDAAVADQRELDWLIALASAFQAQQRQLRRGSGETDATPNSEKDGGVNS